MKPIEVARISGVITGEIHASFCSTLAITLRCNNIAPFDTPVVPPVYCRKTMSSWPCCTGVRVRRAPSASILLKLMAPGKENAGTIFLILRTTKLTIVPFKPPSKSPMVATITCLTWVCGNTCSTVVAKFSSTMIASLPESIS